MPQWVLSFVYGVFARFIGGFMVKLKEARADNPGVVREAQRLMTAARIEWPEEDSVSKDARRRHVIDGMKAYSANFGWEIGTSAVDALIVATLGEWAKR